MELRQITVDEALRSMYEAIRELRYNASIGDHAYNLMIDTDRLQAITEHARFMSDAMQDERDGLNDDDAWDEDDCFPDRSACGSI